MPSLLALTLDCGLNQSIGNLLQYHNYICVTKSNTFADFKHRSVSWNPKASVEHVEHDCGCDDYNINLHFRFLHVDAI